MSGTGALSDVSLLHTRRYSEYFGFRNGEVNLHSNYIWAASDEDILRFGALNIDTATAQPDDTRVLTDTTLEFALLSYYSPIVIQVRPEQAGVILPANDPRRVDLKLGAAVFQELQILRFLSNTAAVGRYEGILRFITDRRNVTSAEIEKYYRNGIRAFIADIVNEEFNKVSFSLRRNNQIGYNAVLTRNSQNGQYILSYGGIETNGETRTVTGNSVDALSLVMRDGGNKNDFSQLSIDTVRAQAALIPAVVYADWRASGVAGGVDAMSLITETLTNFYLSPNQATYDNLRGLYARYNYLVIRENDVFANFAQNSLRTTLSELNTELAFRLGNDISRGNLAAFMRIPTDPRFNIFATRYEGQ